MAKLCCFPAPGLQDLWAYLLQVITFLWPSNSEDIFPDWGHKPLSTSKTLVHSPGNGNVHPREVLAFKWLEMMHGQLFICLWMKGRRYRAWMRWKGPLDIDNVFRLSKTQSAFMGKWLPLSLLSFSRKQWSGEIAISKCYCLLLRCLKQRLHYPTSQIHIGSSFFLKLWVYQVNMWKENYVS